jgi:hypothetical protein
VPVWTKAGEEIGRESSKTLETSDPDQDWPSERATRGIESPGQPMADTDATREQATNGKI